ncbi:hypothetical protein [Geodermatophilus sp. SYSU D01036]
MPTRCAALEVTPGGGPLVVGSDDDGPVLLTVADGGPAERRVDDPGQVLASALSADGGTVYVGLAPQEETGVPARLLAVDAATGEVTATAPLGAGLDPRARSARLLPRPDGGVVAVISNPQPGGAQDWVAEYDADLGTAVAPFGVVAALGASGHTEVSVGVADDGDLVVLTEVPTAAGCPGSPPASSSAPWTRTSPARWTPSPPGRRPGW